MEDLIFSSVRALARLIRSREVSATEVVEAHLRRVEAVNPRLNALVQLAAEPALQQAREADDAAARGDWAGPLHGVPFTAKDSIDTAGIVSTAGTLGRARHVPVEDATVVARLRSAGAILLGKSNTPEFTLAGETDNLVYGRTNNPYDLERSPGGSSGGSAAIVAAGGSPLDIGSDTGGSIRLPAHFCGIAAIKPTAGRLSRSGHVIAHGVGARDFLTQLGPMTRFVDDLALTLPIMAGVDWRDPTVVPMPLGDPADVDVRSLRVAVYTTDGTHEPTPEVIEAVRTAAGVLSEMGATVSEDRPDQLRQSPELALALRSADGGDWVQRMLQEAGTTEMHPMLARMNAQISGSERSAIAFNDLLIELQAFQSAMLSFLESYDALICPVAQFAALPHGSCWPGTERMPAVYTQPFNLTGWPSAVVRAGTTHDGLPVGVQIVARPWREDVALALAKQIETELGGWQRPQL